MDWFTVDKSGLAKLIDKRGKAFAIFELLQNAWDTDAKTVTVKVSSIPNRPFAEVFVKDDDPDGFHNLAHSFTLFAESEKKKDPSKRGRFNIGEKLVLALCEEATIASTKGTVIFDKTGRHETKKKTETGSVFSAIMRMTHPECEDVKKAIKTLIPPQTCITAFNGEPLLEKKILKEFMATLPTEYADDEGFLRRSQRNTAVTIHEVLDGEIPSLYEMGIPVVEFSGGEKFHVNVHQKIPLNVDRDNVTPAYMQHIRVLLANEMRDYISKEDSTKIWANAALEDERIDGEAAKKILDERFGKKRASFDPSDPEANKQLMNEGYTIIPGRALSGKQWERAKSFNLVTSSGSIRPSGTRHDPNGRPEQEILPQDYTKAQANFVEFVKELSWKLLHKEISVRIINEAIALPHSAYYGQETVTFNLGRLGKAWFEDPLSQEHLCLIWHELSHDKVSDHLTRDFSREQARLSAKTVDIALSEPEFFKKYGYKFS